MWIWKKKTSNQDHTYISILCFIFNCYISHSIVYLLHIVCKPSHIAMQNQSCPIHFPEISSFSFRFLLLLDFIYSCEVFPQRGCSLI